MASLIQCERSGEGTAITINRADVGGLVTDEMALELAGMIDAAAATSKYIVYRSAGTDFCLGRDRGANPYAPAKDPLAFRSNSETIFGFYDAFRRSRIPVIGVVQGRALGFGCAVAALCDITIAAEDARFALPEMGHRIMPTIAMSSLVDRVTRKGILYLTYSTREIDAWTALAHGLVSLVVPRGNLETELEYVTSAITKAPMPAVLAAKEYAREALDMDVRSAAIFAATLHATVNTSPQMRE